MIYISRYVHMHIQCRLVEQGDIILYLQILTLSPILIVTACSEIEMEMVFYVCVCMYSWLRLSPTFSLHGTVEIKFSRINSSCLCTYAIYIGS